MEEKKKMTLEALKNALTNSIQNASLNTQALQQDLKQFNDALNDHLDMKLEHQAILDKYVSAGQSGYGNAYNLPGVFSNSMASYDVNSAKADNQRVIELAQLIEETEQQKNYYYDALVSSFNDIVNSLQKVKKYEGNISEFLILLQQKKDY